MRRLPYPQVSLRSTLAVRTIEGRAPALNDPSDRAATLTRLPFAVVDSEALGKIAELAIGGGEVAESRTSSCDRLTEDAVDRLNESFQPLKRDSAARPLRVDFRAVQGLARIDVADPRNNSLVEEQHLDRGHSPGKPPLQLKWIKFQRLWAKHPEGRPFIEFDSRHEVERSKTPRVVECDSMPLVGDDDQMIVLADLTRVDSPVARHSQMKDESVTSVRIDEAIFGASPKLRYERACQALPEIVRQGAPKVGPPCLDPFDATVLEDSGKPADGRFDFGKLGHASRYGGGRPRPLEARTQMSDKVNFGDQLVSPEEKTRRVSQVFSSVARRYDIMNDLMSGGMHRLWKDRFVNRVKPRLGEQILDMAGGTGDVAFRMARRGAHVTVADINSDMLEVGKKRSDRDGLSGLSWKVENAEKLSFGDSVFDAYTIVFGIRNVTDIKAALGEAHRVLKRGGRFYCMEFSSSEWPGFSTLYEAWASNVIPRIGKMVADDEDSYRYLIESIRRFPRPDAFRAMVAGAGFVRAAIEPMLGGLVTIHSGWKI